MYIHFQNWSLSVGQFQQPEAIQKALLMIQVQFESQAEARCQNSRVLLNAYGTTFDTGRM